jgi:predicted O-methyltransferase YrrM
MFERIRIYRENRRYIDYEKRELKKIPRLNCNTHSLRHVKAAELETILTNPKFDQEWNEIAGNLDKHCNLPDGTTSAVNPGDRRALYYLIRGFHPRSVLEIGTHVGASTVHIAAALARENSAQTTSCLTSVDIENVNDPLHAPWRRLGLENSPAQMIQNTGCASLVTFITMMGLDFLRQPPHNFDFIFLDGSHAASVVYQEIPVALMALSQNGVILLHDYYPNNKPLWSSNRRIIPGPWIAIQRLRSEGIPITVQPLGRLPWPTKLGSNVTSLAVLTKDNL